MARTSHGCTGWHTRIPFIPSRYGLRVIRAERARNPARRASPLLAALAALAVLAAATAAPARPPSSAPGVPSDAELESSGAVIGNVTIDNENIFNLDDPKEDKSLYRLADHLHLKTRASVIRHHLLFKPGDHYSRRLLDESERLLRQEGYFYDAWIRAVRYHDGKVDVVVTTKDVWTLNPGFNFGRSGGTNSTGVKLEDSNVLGSGVDVTLSHSSNVDRTATQLSVSDQHAFGTWTAVAANFANLSDGYQREFTIQRPFYAFDTPWAAGVYGIHDLQTDSLWDRGKIIDQFQDMHHGAQVYAGLSQGLQDGWVHRWSTGITYDEHRFAPLPAFLDTNPLAADPRFVYLVPQDRRFLYPWVQFDLIQDDYLRLFNHDQIGRTEDFYVGTSASVRLGFAAASMGSSSNAIIFQSSATRGFRRGRSTLLSMATSPVESAKESSRMASPMPRSATTSSRARTGSSSRPSSAPKDGGWISTTRSCSAATTDCAVIRCATRMAPRGHCSVWSKDTLPTGIPSGCSASAPQRSSTRAVSGVPPPWASPLSGFSRTPASDCASATPARVSATSYTSTWHSPSRRATASSACSSWCRPKHASEARVSRSARC